MSDLDRRNERQLEESHRAEEERREEEAADLDRDVGGVAPELEEPLFCKCGDGPAHPWEPGESCPPERAVPFVADVWPLDDDPPDPL